MKTIIDRLLYYIEKIFSYLDRIGEFFKFYLIGTLVIYLGFQLLKIIFWLLFKIFQEVIMIKKLNRWLSFYQIIIIITIIILIFSYEGDWIINFYRLLLGIFLFPFVVVSILSILKREKKYNFFYFNYSSKFIYRFLYSSSFL